MMTGGILLCWVFAQFPALDAVGQPGGRYIGALLVLSGGGLAVWAVLYFAKAKTPVFPGQTPKTLLDTGPFAFSRNPIYFGMVLILTGAAFWTGSGLGFFLIPIFMWLVTKTHIAHEEASIRATFPTQAEGFFAKTHRWIGLPRVEPPWQRPR